MARIFPFRAYRYAAKIDPASVLTQPYDKITPEMQRRYAAASPFNLIAVEKGLAKPADSPSDDVYTRAAAALENWIAQGVLIRDPEPSMYAYSQTYKVSGAAENVAQHQTRTGLIALGQLDEYSAGVIFRHEQTLSGPKADRLELLRHTRAHIGQLFMIYEDPARRVDSILAQAAGAAPVTQLADEFDVEHRLFRISQTDQLAEIQRTLASQKLVIADGHHRYETALAYRNERRAAAPGATDPAAPYERVMMTLINTAGTPVTILPTHRIVSSLPNFKFAAFRARIAPYFAERKIALAPESAYPATLLDALVSSARTSGPTIAAYAGGGTAALFTLNPAAELASALPDLSPRQRQLDVVLLHRLILEKGLGISDEAVRQEKNLRYERDAARAIEAVRTGAAQIAFLLNPTPLAAVIDVATHGEVMPQKSTDFYPKLLSGIAIYRLED